MEDYNTYDREWIKRALNPSTPTTEAMETVKTESREYQGKEILFPTIRMINGKLINLGEKAMDYAIEKGDFITFNTPQEANAFSIGLSNMIDMARNTNKKIMSSMKKQYGKKRGEQVFYASLNKKKIKGVKKRG